MTKGLLEYTVSIDGTVLPAEDVYSVDFAFFPQHDSYEGESLSGRSKYMKRGSKKMVPTLTIAVKHDIVDGRLRTGSAADLLGYLESPQDAPKSLVVTPLTGKSISYKATHQSYQEGDVGGDEGSIHTLVPATPEEPVVVV